MTKAERESYERHLDNLMVQNDVLDVARQEGRDEGIEEEKMRIGRNLIKLGLPDETIQAATQLSLQIISELRMR